MYICACVRVCVCLCVCIKIYIYIYVYQGSDRSVGEAICIEGGDSRIERHCRVVPHIAKLQPLYRTPPYTSVSVCPQAHCRMSPCYSAFQPVFSIIPRLALDF